MTEPADAARIRQFAADVPGGLPALVEQFIQHSADTVRDLRAAADAGTASPVHLLAHRGAGTAGVVGAAPLMELLRRTEALGKQGDIPAARDAVAEVEAELARVHAFLRTLLQHPSSAA
jgi:HPt (histidine-containing phosphotransfer) domain-containing protein